MTLPCLAPPGDRVPASDWRPAGSGPTVPAMPTPAAARAAARIVSAQGLSTDCLDPIAEIIDEEVAGDAAAAFGAIGGATRSRAKSAAARANGASCGQSGAKRGKAGHVKRNRRGRLLAVGCI